MVHILDRHTATGRTAVQSGIKDLFPDHMTPKQIENAIKEAYSNAKRLQTQGERIKVIGESSIGKIEIWVNKVSKTIETAYPKGAI